MGRNGVAISDGKVMQAHALGRGAAHGREKLITCASEGHRKGEDWGKS